MSSAARYTVRELKTSEFAHWDEFVDLSPSGTVFNLSSCLQADARLFDNNSMQIFGVFHNDRLIAGLSAYVRKRGPLQVIAAPIMSFYHSVTLQNDLLSDPYHRTISEHRQFEALLPFLEKKFDAIELSLSPEITDIRPFLWRDWQTRVSYTYRVTLASDDKILQSFNKNMRRLIKRGEDEKLTFGPCRDISAIARLSDRVYEQQNLSAPLSTAQIEKLLTGMFRLKNLLSYGAYDRQGNLLAVDVILVDRKRAYMFLSASDPDQRQLGGTAFLRWHTFREIRQYTNEVDLTGADIPSIAHFKSTMGGRLVSYYRVKKQCSLAGKSAMKLYEMWHR